MECVWEEDIVKQFCNYLYNIIDYHKCVELERELRIETGTEDKMTTHMKCHDHSSHSKKNLGTHKFKKDDNDTVGEFIDDEKSEDKLIHAIPQLTEKAFHMYTNVINKAKTEGNANEVTIETDNFIRTDIFKLLILQYIMNRVRKRVKDLQCQSTNDIVTLANPINLTNVELNKISNETMASLMKNGFGIQNGLIGKRESSVVFKELEFIEFNNQFNEFGKAYKDMRTDYHCWSYISSLDREKQKALCKLLKLLSLIPYELNQKANLSLQVCLLFQFSYFSPMKSFLKNHIEGGYGALDNGKKITCIYVPYVQADEQVQIKIYKNIEGANGQNNMSEEDPIFTLSPQSDTLLLLQTRNISYEITQTRNKLFFVNFWIPGRVSSDIKF